VKTENKYSNIKSKIVVRDREKIITNSRLNRRFYLPLVTL
jgi:hypothetical protein